MSRLGTGVASVRLSGTQADRSGPFSDHRRHAGRGGQQALTRPLKLSIFSLFGVRFTEGSNAQKEILSHTGCGKPPVIKGCIHFHALSGKT